MVKRSVLFGLAMGVYAIVSVYVGASLLPGWFAPVIPLAGLAGAVAYFWPRWFDREPSDSALRRLRRRVTALACAVPAAALASFLVVWLWPGYIDWADDLHRESLRRRQVSAEEIERRVALHHATPPHFLLDGALMMAVPGVIASLATTAGGMLRRRRRPRS